LWNALHYVDQNYVRQFLICNPKRAVRANVPCTHNRDFFSHTELLFVWGNWKFDYNRLRGESIAAVRFETGNNPR
jgi:hypothetical protein